MANRRGRQAEVQTDPADPNHYFDPGALVWRYKAGCPGCGRARGAGHAPYCPADLDDDPRGRAAEKTYSEACKAGDHRLCLWSWCTCTCSHPGRQS